MASYRFIARNGDLNVVRKNHQRAFWTDLYHWLIRIKWRHFWLLLVLVYFGVNVAFALLYVAGGDCIHGAEAGSLTDAFFFSIQSIATIGYGAMYPKTMWADVLVAIESFAGLVLTALATGLVFAKFARPTARVTFSQRAVITTFEGKPTLIFRMANMRGNQIVDASLNVLFARFEETEEGERFRRLRELELVRDRTSMFALTWSAMHVIDEESPLHGLDAEQWRSSEAELVVSVSGVDSTLGQTVHARYSYTIEELCEGARFVDMFHVNDDGILEIDYANFDLIEKV